MWSSRKCVSVMCSPACYDPVNDSLGLTWGHLVDWFDVLDERCKRLDPNQTKDQGSMSSITPWHSHGCPNLTELN